MANVKDPASVAAKWGRRAANSQQEYVDGVQNPRTSWATASKNANDTWKQGVTQAAARDAFSKGVTAAGDQAWQMGATQKGPARFSEGVTIGAPTYQQGVAKYLQVIAATPLPPRGPKGDPRNLQRVAAISTALRKAKTG